MPIDPSISHRSRIDELEEEKKKHKELSPEWLKINQQIRFHEIKIKHVERMKKMGVKW